MGSAATAWKPLTPFLQERFNVITVDLPGHGKTPIIAGLIFIIFAALDQKRDKKIPTLVACWIGAAYFFTSSTSFANPAVTFARGWSDTFAGIAPESIAPFMAAQLIGAVLGLLISQALSVKSKGKK